MNAITLQSIELSLSLPDNDQPTLITCRQVGLVVVESHRQGRARVRLQFVDARLGGSGRVEEEDAAVLAARHHDVSAAAPHERGEC